MRSLSRPSHRVCTFSAHRARRLTACQPLYVPPVNDSPRGHVRSSFGTSPSIATARGPLLPCPAVRPAGERSERSLGQTADEDTAALENLDRVRKKTAGFGVFAPRLPRPPSRLSEVGTPCRSRRKSWLLSPAPAPEPEPRALAWRKKQTHRQLPTPLGGTSSTCNGVESVTSEHVPHSTAVGDRTREGP